MFDNSLYYYCINEQQEIDFKTLHIHINPVGGIAGDMFVAAVVDLVPELEPPMLDLLQGLDLPADITTKLESHQDSVMVGRKFTVSEPHTNHHHVGYKDIQKYIANAQLPDSARTLANRIIDLIAAAEAEVHGVALEDVVLHEVGSMDSVIDVLCSSFLISSLGDVTWSCDPLPAGKGYVETEHGELPLPVPAVVNLLKGFPLYDDGRAGERVTPTGAAILRAINPEFQPKRDVMNLTGTGIGFGTSTFEGISNIVRLVAYEPIESNLRHEQVGVIEFEVDDQTMEDLAIGLNRIRVSDGVLDVLQMPAIGKKGRMSVHVRVLSEVGSIDEVALVCLAETSTLGVRRQVVDRVAIDRQSQTYAGDDIVVPTKIASRPDGTDTAKVESDHLSEVGNYSERKKFKQQVELSVEQQAKNDD